MLSCTGEPRAGNADTHCFHALGFQVRCMWTVVSITIVGWLCAACAAHNTPLAVMQAQNRYMDCAEIADESEANNQKVANLTEKRRKANLSVRWTSEKEITALRSSSSNILVALAEQQRCGTAALRATFPAD